MFFSPVCHRDDSTCLLGWWAMVADDTAPAAETTGLSRAERLDLLASKRRQRLLELLATSADDAHTLESLATAIAQTEQGDDLGARPSRRVSLLLHHVHLPKLDHADIVAYDSRQKVVECTDTGRAERLLETTGR